MIKKYKIFAVIASLILLFPSCNLDELPKDSISLEDAWQSVDDAKNFRTGIYAYFRSINGGLYSYTPDYQSDLFNATIGYGNRGGEMHRWDFNSSQYDIEDTWQYNYYTINNCNNIINNIDNIEEDDAILATIKGEAYLMRAICYHTLVVRFAKDYDPSTAASNLGLPLVYNNDPTEKPSRSTLEETYTQIKEDITEARKYLTTAGAPNAEYFTKDVIDAFEARVNLYMHQYAGAVTLAKNIISAYPLLQSENDLKNMWLNDQSSEIIFRTFMSISERTNDMTNFLGYSTSANAFQPDFVPSQWVLDLYENSDIRKGTYFKKDKIVSNNVETNDVYMLNKYPGNPVLTLDSEARDPNMFWNPDTKEWTLVLAHALDHEMLIFTSPDMKEWTLQSRFGRGLGAQDGVWECPDLFELPVEGTDEKKWVLLCNLNPGGPFGGSATQYFIGDFDGKHLYLIRMRRAMYLQNGSISARITMLL